VTVSTGLLAAGARMVTNLLRAAEAACDVCRAAQERAAARHASAAMTPGDSSRPGRGCAPCCGRPGHPPSAGTRESVQLQEQERERESEEGEAVHGGTSERLEPVW